MIKECKHCNKEFEAKGKITVCGEECKKLANKEYVKEYNQRPEVKEKQKKYMKEYFQRPEAKESKKEHSKRYWQKPENKENEKQRMRERRKDIMFKLNDNMSSSIRLSLKSKHLSKAGKSWKDLVGYGPKELKEHLESLFKPGMSWENRSAWHMDHKIPKSFFKYTSTKDVEFKMCWSLDNLQPLWAEENLSKHDKILL